MEDATRDLISLKREPEGVVNLGHPPSVGTVILPDIVGRVIKKFPKISLVIHESGSTELYEWLVDGRLDVALIHDPEPSKNMIAEELLVENVYVVGTDANELSKNESISLEELSKLPLILPDQDRYPRKALEDGLAVRGLALNSVVEVNSAHIMRCLALQGFGYAILPLSFVLEDVEAGRLNAIRIDSPDVVQSLSTVTTTFHPVSAATRAVAHMIKKEFLILAKTKYSESVTIA